MCSRSQIIAFLLSLLAWTIPVTAQAPMSRQSVATVVVGTRLPPQLQEQMVDDIAGFTHALVAADGPQLAQFLFDETKLDYSTAVRPYRTTSLTCISSALMRTQFTDVEITGLGELDFNHSLPPDERSWTLKTTVEWRDGPELRRKNCFITCARQDGRYKFIATQLAWVVAGTDCIEPASKASATRNGRPTSDCSGARAAGVDRLSFR